MEKINLNEEILERLLSEMTYYTLDEDNTKEALKYLKEILKGISSKSEEHDITVAYRDYRLKELNSFLNKILKNITNDNNLTYNDMHDIAASRLTVLTLSDIYKVRDIIANRDDIRVLEEKDYIKKPKPSGYRSLHMILEVPVDTEHGIKYIKSEIQLRTILQDIFAKLEWIIRYKGNCSEEDACKLEALSNTLSIFDFYLDDSLRNRKNTKEEIPEFQLAQFGKVLDRLTGLIEDLHDKFYNQITDIIGDFDNRYNVLHKESRIKSKESIIRKANEKGLGCTTEDVLYNINDVIGFKIVCIDLEAAKSLVNKLLEGIENTENLSVAETSDHFDTPKESGYRGYKISVAYNSPLSLGKPIKFEILVRTLFMDAWALHHDIIYKDAESKERYGEVFRRLSDEFYSKEKELTKIRKNLSEEEDTQLDLVNTLYDYNNSKKAKKLILENTQKNEE